MWLELTSPWEESYIRKKNSYNKLESECRSKEWSVIALYAGVAALGHITSPTVCWSCCSGAYQHNVGYNEQSNGLPSSRDEQSNWLPSSHTALDHSSSRTALDHSSRVIPQSLAIDGGIIRCTTYI